MTVQKYQPVATGAGRIAESSLATSAKSMVAENTIKFGKAVKLGTDPELQVKGWDGNSSNDVFSGIALHGITGDLDNNQFLEGHPVAVLKKGAVWVRVAEGSQGVTAGQKAAVLPNGDFTSAPLTAGTGGTYGVEIEGSEFLTSGSEGDLVKLLINLPATTKTVQI